MKKLLFAALLLVCTPAMAEAPPPAAPPPAATGGEGVRPEINFEEHKAKMLEFMSNQIARFEKGKACIQAAENPEALKACRPEGKRPRHMLKERSGKRGSVPGQNAPPPGQQDTSPGR